MGSYISKTETGTVTVSILNNRYHTGNYHDGLPEYADGQGLYLLKRTDRGWERINHLDEITPLSIMAKLRIYYKKLIGRAQWLYHKLSLIVIK